MMIAVMGLYGGTSAVINYTQSRYRQTERGEWDEDVYGEAVIFEKQN